ncbi:hypothetical protein GF356_07780 [candidate division GN15 bacterium]|nr:hypothetical protein [candidate division GN15 bacterium]
MRIKVTATQFATDITLQSLSTTNNRPNSGSSTRPLIALIDGRFSTDDTTDPELWRSVKNHGWQCIAARKVPRQVFRDGINNGVAVIELSSLPPVEFASEIDADLKQGRLEWSEGGSSKTVTFTPLGEYLIEVLKAGSLVDLVKKSFQ